VTEKLLKDKDASVRRIAIPAYGRLGQEKVIGILAGMFSDENVLVRHQTALVLGRIGGNAAKAALQQQLAKETNARQNRRRQRAETTGKSAAVAAGADMDSRTKKHGSRREIGEIVASSKVTAN
jgi:HEAT repeat protein